MGLRLPKLFRIRARTAAALSIPLAMLLAAAGLQVTQSGREAADVREQGELATASIGPAGAINALMTERNFTSLWLFGVEQGVELHVDSVDEARERTDASLAAFEGEVRRRGGRAERIYGPAIEALAALDDNRARVDAYDGVRNPTVENESGDRVWATYNRLVTALADANTQLANEVEDAQLRQGVRLVDMATRQVDRISKMVRASTIEAVQAGGPITDPIEFSRGVRMMSEGDRHHLALLDLVTGPYAALREPLREESEATGIFEVEQQFSETGEVHIAGLLEAVSIDEDESYYGFIHDVSAIIRDRADHLAAAARADQQRTIVLSVLVMVTAVGAALAVARSITAPLRSLTRQARDMAERRLPEAVREVHETPLGDDVRVPELEPVSVTSRDEVSDLADQLNAVQLAALDLAVEQAVLRRNFADVFVNLCRRIQALLGRQLDVIAEVGGAGYPGRAGRAGYPGRARRAGPDLGEVSRYAIRLRRHAESLLVLAGVEPRPASSAPAPLGDIVQAALREASGSERVRLLGVEPVVVAGSAVADLAHLLAELVESALRELFPEETVDLAGVAGRGPGSGYTLRIVDPGASLAEEEIERANRRLAGEEPGTTAPSRYLGQYVAARLAARHGISVALTGTMAAGVTATVHLPPPLLTPAPAPARPAAPEPSPAAVDSEPPTAEALPTRPGAAEPSPAVVDSESPTAEALPTRPGVAEPPAAEGSPAVVESEPPAAEAPSIRPRAAEPPDPAAAAGASPATESESPAAEVPSTGPGAAAGAPEPPAAEASPAVVKSEASAVEVPSSRSGAAAGAAEPPAAAGASPATETELSADAEAAPASPPAAAAEVELCADAEVEPSDSEMPPAPEAEPSAAAEGEPPAAAQGASAAAEGEPAAALDVGPPVAGVPAEVEPGTEVGSGAVGEVSGATRVLAGATASEAEPGARGGSSAGAVSEGVPGGAGDVEGEPGARGGLSAAGVSAGGLGATGGLSAVGVSAGGSGAGGALSADGEPGGEGDTGPPGTGEAGADEAATTAVAADSGTVAAGEAEAEAELDSGESVGTGGAPEPARPPEAVETAWLLPPSTSGGVSSAAEGGQEPHPSGPNQVVPSGDDDVDVYRLLSDFTEGVEHPALAVPNARRRPASDAHTDGD